MKPNGIGEMLSWWNTHIEERKKIIIETRMKKLTLIRVAYTDFGTFGVLKCGNIPFCVTLEREWRNNEKGKSCIPIGDYGCRRIKSPKFGDTFEIINVPNRTEILFHSGNIDDDSHGCILLAEMFEPLFGEEAITNPFPGKAMKEFLERLKGINEFYLEIKDGE